MVVLTIQNSENGLKPHHPQMFFCTQPTDCSLNAFHISYCLILDMHFSIFDSQNWLLQMAIVIDKKSSPPLRLIGSCTKRTSVQCTISTPMPRALLLFSAGLRALGAALLVQAFSCMYVDCSTTTTAVHWVLLKILIWAPKRSDNEALTTIDFATKPFF